MEKQEGKINYQALNLASLIGLTAIRLEMIAERLIFKPLKLTSASFRILMVVGKLGEITPKEILKYLGGTKSNITQRLNYLKRLSLVDIKKPASGDQRQINVSLTTQGSATLARISARISHNQLHFEKYFTPSEMNNFLAFIIKLNEKLDDCGGNNLEVCKNKFCKI